ncbi:MAG: metal-sensitive transcriptional regulator [Spirochaetales bacterium]|nr:metal-sensitive transcriptional regulator [Spirochaetales bacterium]
MSDKHQHHGDHGRRAHHSEKAKQQLVNRLKRIEGQVRGITRMIEEDVYCDDVLNQISSIGAALYGVRRILLEAHIRSCVVEQIKEGQLSVIDELMITIGKMTK